MTVKSSELMAMVEEQNFKCNLSGVDLSPAMSSLDHKLPVSRGGDNTLENLQIIHPVVNYAKARLTNDQFVAMCHAVARLHADTQDDSWHAHLAPPQ